MKWLYEIEYMDGETESIESRCDVNGNQSDIRNLIIYVNEHGHDRRCDLIIIPLVNVRCCKKVEVQ